MEIIYNKYRNQLLKHDEQKKELNNKLTQLKEFRKENWNLLDEEDKEILYIEINKISGLINRSDTEIKQTQKLFNKLIDKFNYPDIDEKPEEEIINEPQEEMAEISSDDNESETTTETESETPTEELKKPTEFKNMEELFNNFINSKYIKTKK